MTTANRIKPALNQTNRAKFVFAVTLYASLAACSHKPVENEAVDMTPVAVSDESAVAGSESPIGDAPTPFPEANQTIPGAAAAPAPRKSVVAHHARRAHGSARRHGKKISHHRAHRHAVHAVPKSGPRAAAAGRVGTPPEPTLPPPPAVTPDSTQTQGALDETGASATPSLGGDDQIPARSLWFVGSALLALAVLVGSYRAMSKRRARGIVFNA